MAKANLGPQLSVSAACNELPGYFRHFYRIYQKNAIYDIYLYKKARAGISAKIKSAEALIGFPQFAIDEEKLDQLYQYFKVIENDFLANIVSFIWFTNVYSLHYSVCSFMAAILWFDWLAQSTGFANWQAGHGFGELLGGLEGWSGFAKCF